ncbi:MAG: DNA-processing protein DprA [Bacteroidales bacterium]|nr:DNA-processing protein DprA [Bacteroidales bacterium]
MSHKTQEQLLYQIGITLLPGVGDVNAKKLIAYCGGVEAVFKQKKSQLLKIDGIGSKLADAIINQTVLKRAEEEILFIEKNKIQTFFFTDKNFPIRLKQAMDSPIILYYKGNANLNQRKILSVVGTRKVTERGKAICDKIISGFEDEEVLIISGLAYGVDTQAHKSSLKYGLNTVGILAHGLDRIYPDINRGLAKRMIEHGGLLTDFISKTIPDAPNFPKRNRIIAGLSDAVLVIESASKGGSLITADIANSYNRDVFAVPGRPDDKYSKGCNFLIRSNRAALVESAKDIRYLMGWDTSKKEKIIQRKLFVELKPEEELLMKIIREEKDPTIDLIALKAQMPMSKVSVTLLNMEFEGLLRCLPGKVFKPV